MDEYFAAFPVTNATVICVGSITAKEAEAAKQEGLVDDTPGYYLFLAKEGDRDFPIQVLAKFVSNAAAEQVAKIFLRTAAA